MSRCSRPVALDQRKIPTDFQALVLVNGQPRKVTRGMLWRGGIRQIVRPLLEHLPHLLHVPIPIIDRGHAPIGMPEHSLDELVARIAEAFREACRNRPTQIERTSEATHDQPGATFLVDPRNETRRELFDAMKVAESLGKLTRPTTQPATPPEVVSCGR